ncbi:MAG: hypothetical protein SNI58_08745 [Rikenellaceae bacterium]
MKVNQCKNGTITISGLSVDMYNAMSAILNRANDTCFEEQDNDEGWYSNDDFVVLLDDMERTVLSGKPDEIDPLKTV